MACMAETVDDAWGVVPPRFVLFIRLVQEEIATAASALGSTRFQTTAGNAEPALTSAIAHTNDINALSKDLRAALSAYAHKIHEPRPRVLSVAEAQGTTSQGLVRRYNDAVETAVRSISNGTATREDLEHAFPSLQPALITTLLEADSQTYFNARVAPPK